MVGQTNQGKIGGVGIMQLYNPQPSDEAIWNWRQNLAEGLMVLNKKRQESSRLHITKLGQQD